MMHPSHACNVLREFNQWRRGEGDYAWDEHPEKNKSLPYTPAIIGQAIDTVVDIVENKCKEPDQEEHKTDDKMRNERLVKIATSLAEDQVGKFSDFWIARTNPYDPDFANDTYFKSVFTKTLWNIILQLHPEIGYDNVIKAIRVGFLNALNKEKDKRMKEMSWNPYGNETTV